MTREEEYDLCMVIKRIERNKYKPDRHSFTAQTEEGSVFVEAQEYGIYIYYEENNGKRHFFAGKALYATNKLIELKIKLDTIEM